MRAAVMKFGEEAVPGVVNPSPAPTVIGEVKEKRGRPQGSANKAASEKRRKTEHGGAEAHGRKNADEGESSSDSGKTVIAALGRKGGTPRKQAENGKPFRGGGVRPSAKPPEIGKAFGEGILFARKTLADLLSEKAWLEKNLAFKEVGLESRHLLSLRNQLNPRTPTDMFDARVTTRTVVAYLAQPKDAKSAPEKAVGTLRVVSHRPLACERLPGIERWLEGKGLSVKVAELSHLYVLEQYRKGAVTVPLIAYVYKRILKPADVKYVLICVERTLMEQYVFKHFQFLGFHVVEQTDKGEVILAVDLEKAVSLLYGPWRFT